MIGLAFGAFAVVVIAAEIPSGVFADLHGRKASFIIACALSALSCVVLMASKTFLPVMAGLMLFGLSAAFSSGSLDALIVEEALAQHGQDGLSKTVGELAAFQCAGIAAGALLGGLLPEDGGYAAHLYVRLFMAAGTGLLAVFLLQEQREPKPDTARRLKLHVGQMLDLLRSSRVLVALLICILVIAATQSMVEIYWQPRLVSFDGNVRQTYLGLICAGGYIVTTLASLLMGRVRLNNDKTRRVVYFALCAALALGVILLAMQTALVLFAAGYILVYLCIGLMAVPEQTLINAEISNDVRASLLSVVSFSARLGALLSSLAGSVMLLKMDIGKMWTADAVVTLCMVAFVGALSFIKGK
jgi:predicted MFS family arabinose efflux permease